jgi:hypothetical protein
LVTSRPTGKTSTGFIVALIVLSVSVWLPRLQGPLDLRFDAGVYYVLGTSLAEGNGYRLLSEPGEIRAVQYPPGLPVLIASIQKIAGTSDPAVVGYWLRLTYFAMFVTFVLTVYALSARYLPPGFAFLATLVTLLHANTIWMSELLFSEIPYALMSMLFLLVAGRKASTARECTSGFLGVTGFLLRSTGLALLAAWVGESLFRRRFRQMAVRSLVALLPVILWQGYTATVKTGADYAEWQYEYQRTPYQFYNVTYTDNLAYVDPFIPELGTVTPKLLGKRIALNLLSMPASLGQALSARADWSRTQFERINESLRWISLPLWLVDLGLIALGGLSCVGLLLLARRGEYLIPLYVAAALALICLTPWPGQFSRYLTPLAPLIALGLFVTLAAALEKFRNSAVPSLKYGTIGFVFVVCLGIFGQEAFALWKIYSKQYEFGLTYFEDRQGVRHPYRLLFYTQEWAAHDDALAWLKDRAAPPDVVATSTPHWFYLKSGIKSVLPPFEPDTGEAQRLLEDVPVRYLVVDSLEFVDITRRYALPAVNAFPGRWELVFSSGGSGSQIYRLRD